MRSKATLLGHPVHAFLVMFPTAFYCATWVGYAVYAFTRDPFVFRLGVVANVAAVVAAAVAAMPGLFDWSRAISDRHPAKAVGALHMGLQVVALLFFALDAVLMVPEWSAAHPAYPIAIALATLGAVPALVGGYVGRQLVQKHHVGIDLTPVQEQIDVAQTRVPYTNATSVSHVRARETLDDSEERITTRMEIRR